MNRSSYKTGDLVEYVGSRNLYLRGAGIGRVVNLEEGMVPLVQFDRVGYLGVIANVNLRLVEPVNAWSLVPMVNPDVAAQLSVEGRKANHHASHRPV